ncbi:carboxymuconolactone decarboxylase family protein [Paenibacillus favisporus]|uniref:carboxymuconolactone decarboxylase family protein n=1 Tax=Paenibacillus favisporus TaxID=221028 RepID=UPI002DBAFAFB|nr:hypothetical protein [Paenibacillus favisporus]MEC0175068.1 carboxymuconolactone decarboxylase family protein [Paenibacillus favisporus]
MAKLIVEFHYGTLYSRPSLDLKQRSLLTIAAMIASGYAGILELSHNTVLLNQHFLTTPFPTTRSGIAHHFIFLSP